MSEEEILKECTELAENEHHKLGNCWDEEYSSSAIFGLIMLYKQTKKELNNLKEIEKSHQEENGKLGVEFEKVYEDNLTLAHELEQEKEKNMQLNEKNITYKNSIPNQSNFYDFSNYISKDKIRKKLEHQNMLWNTPNRQKEYNREFAEFLEELLEEK